MDVYEEEPQSKSNVLEITLDDSKDKSSSDKENEIIMIRDSDSDNGDDEDEEEEDEDEHTSGNRTKFNGAMRCKHCSRNFRQRRTFDTHLRICEKSPDNSVNLDEKKQKDKEKIQTKKQYACKICQEKFDVVVALARHVRAAHSQRKKHKLELNSPKYELVFAR